MDYGTTKITQHAPKKCQCFHNVEVGLYTEEEEEEEEEEEVCLTFDFSVRG